VNILRHGNVVPSGKKGKRENAARNAKSTTSEKRFLAALTALAALRTGREKEKNMWIFIAKKARNRRLKEEQAPK